MIRQSASPHVPECKRVQQGHTDNLQYDFPHATGRASILDALGHAFLFRLGSMHLHKKEN